MRATYLALLALLLAGLAGCSSAAGPSKSSHGTTTGQHHSSLAATSGHNPPRLEYLLVQNGSGKPRTYFSPGQPVEVNLEVYATVSSLGNVQTHWQVTHDGRSLRTWTRDGGFSGPTRGNLFHLLQTRLPTNGGSGTYDARVSLTIQGHALGRSVRYYVRG